jgi:phosphatidylglycerol lysyltransferase
MQKTNSNGASTFSLWLVSTLVMLNGILLILDTLAEQLRIRGFGRANGFIVSVPLLVGLTLVYLSMLLRRRKRAAFLVVIPFYVVIFGLNVGQVAVFVMEHRLYPLAFIRTILVPLFTVSVLLYYHREFTVRSGVNTFPIALRRVILILAVAFVYGVMGFTLLDMRDFHEEISLGQAAHYTIDQFGLTTDHTVQPHTRRAKVFTDSLAIVSAGSVLYAVVSLFAPIRYRLTDQSLNRERMQRLLEHYPSNPEDFFKLWPHDKTYYFNREGTAGLAYHVSRGVALVVGDCVGNPDDHKWLLKEFFEMCRSNDWQPAILHTANPEFYRKLGFTVQKIGEEGTVDIGHFCANVAPGKYFRQINNRFGKLGYTCEMLQPPHNDALINRLRDVSNDWLELPGRTERGFMMGYFSEAYIQQCAVMVARDAAGTIQAFINQVPTVAPHEANYDFLRHMRGGPGNLNDFLLSSFIKALKDQGYTTLTLGLSPLSGLDAQNKEQGAINNLLHFVYSNGDRLYSFSGLRRFKAKYEPEWTDRFIAYRGGPAGFTRVIVALGKVMGKVKAEKPKHQK